MKKYLGFVTLLSACLLLSCEELQDLVPDFKKEGKLSHYSNQVIIDWNLATLDAMGGPSYQHPLLASRLNAMVHIAMHDALNAIEPAFEFYAYQEKDAAADPIAAAASAAYTVLVNNLPDQREMLDARLNESLAGVKSGERKDRGITLGMQAAQAILDLRQDDGSSGDPAGSIEEPSTEPGVFQHVPPYDFIFAPFWKDLEPFSLESPDQFRLGPPPMLTSKTYTDDFNEVKSLGGKESADRTPDQSALAGFWYEFSEIGWNQVARTAVEIREPSLLATARLFALLNIAIADGYIAGWDTRFHYNFWRPYTAIRAAETDGNPDTGADPSWESYQTTPPVPEYPSNHSMSGNAAAAVLTHVLGNYTSFTMISTTAYTPGTSRTFSSFSQAADENAESRIMAGIHFRFSTKAGQEFGDQIGKWVIENHLKQLKK
jgi:hypothetical protein